MTRQVFCLLTCSTLAVAACTTNKTPVPSDASSSTGDSQKIPTKVPVAVHQRAAASGSVRVIVRISQNGALKDNVDGLRKRISSKAEVQAYRRLGQQPLVALTADEKVLDVLENSPEVEGVVLDTAARAMATRTIKRIRADEVWQTGVQGSGASVAILDTGIDASHPYFQARVIEQACFSASDRTHTSLCPNGQNEDHSANAATPTPISFASHGTHVAGIAAGFNGSYEDCMLDGVARQTNIVAVQVFTHTADAIDCGADKVCLATYKADQISALEYLRDHHARLKLAAVNLSFAEDDADRYVGSCDGDERKQPIDELLAAGVATIAAAGNRHEPYAVSKPSCISSAFTVGGLSLGGAPILSAGNMVDLFAPGSCVASAIPGAAYAEADGTSVAAPLVSGAIALLRSADRPVSTQAILTALVEGATTVTDCRSGESKKALDLAAAWERLPAPAQPRAAADGVVPISLTNPAPDGECETPTNPPESQRTLSANDCSVPEPLTCPSLCDASASAE